jgi:outer membrane biosynthesis protein TonB
MNGSYLQTHFEKEKNLKAFLFTVLICIALFFVLFFISWSLPQIPVPVQDQGIEVNLGNSETGLGDVAPQMPGEPTIAEETNNNPPKTSAAPKEPEQTKDLEDNDDADTPPIRASNKPVKQPKPNVTETPVVKKTTTQPVTNPTPAPPKPKAVYKGGTSTAASGGNGADSYNGVKNQGIAGGSGDQGKPNGNPNSDSYSGNGGTGKSGVTIRSGLAGRRFAKLPSFQDEFNENAKVAVDIVVDRSGNVTSASVNPRGTTTTNANIRSIAVTKARQLKLNAGNEEEQSGTIVFDFKLRG